MAFYGLTRTCNPSFALCITRYLRKEYGIKIFTKDKRKLVLFKKVCPISVQHF